MDDKNKSKEPNSMLNSKKSDEILLAIETFRSSGEVSSLPEFIEVVLNSENPEIVKKGTQVLYDIKDEGAASVIFNCLTNEKYRHLQSQLVAVLWEAGMNCEDRLEDLIFLAIKGDSSTVLESLTVIENIEASYSFDGITELKMNVIECMEQNPDDELKNQLLNSLCMVLDGLTE
jgi:hypothetical protein